MKKMVHSLKFKILVMVMGFFLLGIVAESIIWLQCTVEQSQQTISDNFYSSIQISNQNFENSMIDIDRISALLSSNASSSSCIRNYLKVISDDSQASDYEKVTAGREVYQYLFHLCNFKYYLNGISVCGLNGNQQKFGIIMSGKELLKQEWLQEFLANSKEMCIVSPHKSIPSDENYDEKVFSIIRKVKQGNEILGIVLVDVKYSMLSDFYHYENIENYKIVINDATDGMIVYPYGEDSLAIESGDIKVRNGNSFVEIHDEQYLLMNMEMPVTNWNISGLIPYRDIIHGVMGTMYLILSVTILILTLVCVGIILTVCYVTKELTLLTTAVQRIDMNKLELGIAIKSHDEVGSLYEQIQDMIEKIRVLIAEIQIAEAEKREFELLALQEQINPHFLYNTLNTISYLASFRGMTNIQEVAGALSDMLHLAMDPTKYITIQEEMRYIERYLEIMKYKYCGKFVSEMQIEEDVKEFIIPKLILQPIVENCLKHGIAPLTRQGNILIKIWCKEEVVFIQVRDNGQGMSKEVQDELNAEIIKQIQGRRNIGIRNVRDRLKLIYREQCSFRIISQPDEFTVVQISIPALRNGEK